MTQSPRDKLDQQIEFIYDLLAKYPLPKIVNCQGYRGDARKRCLKSLTPDDFRDLRGEHIWYGLEELSTEQYKALVPRLLEILIEYDFGIPEEDRLTFKDLGDPFNKWTQLERSSITKYFILLWKYVLSEYPAPTVTLLENVLQGLSYWTDDLTTYFKIWESQFDQLPALRHLAMFLPEVTYYYGYFFHPERWKQIKSWMSRPELADIMIKAYIKYEDEPFADEFAKAADSFPKSNDSEPDE